MSESKLNFLPWIKPIGSPPNQEELRQLATVARQDGHSLIAPTHIAMRQGEIVGYASLGKIPMSFCWLSTSKVRARESWHLLNTAENLMAALGAPAIMMPCTQDSPFHPFMENLGYAKIGSADLFFKKF